MSSKSIVIILSYTVSKAMHFLCHNWYTKLKNSKNIIQICIANNLVGGYSIEIKMIHIKLELKWIFKLKHYWFALFVTSLWTWFAGSLMYITRYDTPGTSLMHLSASTDFVSDLFKIAVMTCEGQCTSAYISYFTGVTDVPSLEKLRSSWSNELVVPPFNLYYQQTGFFVSSTNLWTWRSRYSDSL